MDIVSTDLDIETSSHMDFLRLKECVDFRVSCQLKPQHGRTCFLLTDYSKHVP